MATIIYSNGTAEVTVPANEKIAVFSNSPVSIFQLVGYPNFPNSWSLLETTDAGEEYVSSAFSSGATLRVEASAAQAFYETGSNPSVAEPQADISGADATFTVSGLAAAQGGYVEIKGGTSSTSGNAGGAAKLTGGQPGATGVGGAATVAAGAGGATSGAGGVASLTGGVGTAGNSAGGAATVAGGAGQGTGAGGAASLTGGVSGAGATGNGGAASLTGGAASSTNGTGGAAAVTGGAGTGTGNGGAAKLVPGVSGGSGVAGTVQLGIATGLAAVAVGVVRSTVANAGTVSDAQHRGMVLYQDASGGNVTMTTRTGTQLDAAFPDIVTGQAIPQYMASNHATNTSTISGGSGVTLVGSGAVTQVGGSFLLIKTGSATYDLVRVG